MLILEKTKNSPVIDEPCLRNKINNDEHHNQETYKS